MNSSTAAPTDAVPTLTEAVDPASVTSTAVSFRVDIEDLINQVQRQLQPIFERRLQEEFEHLVRSMVQKQWDGASVKLQTEMEMLVRQAVLDALQRQDPTAAAT